MRAWLILVLCLGFAGGCSDSDRGGGGDGGGSGGDGGEEIRTDGGGTDSGSGCDPSGYDAQTETICRALHPPAPEPGELGASCTDDAQCDSNVCLEPFGSSAYCSLECPSGDECPKGYSCQDTGTSLGSACYEGPCVYGGSDAADCIGNLDHEVEEATCTNDCTGELESWLGCLEGAGLLCGSSEADEACGIERGRLESCCPTCGGPAAW